MVNVFLYFIQKGINVISILKENKTDKEIVGRFMDRNEDFITHDERIPVVKIVCQHIVKKDPLQYYPSTETKELYAASILKAFPCLGTKNLDQDLETDQPATVEDDNVLKSMVKSFFLFWDSNANNLFFFIDFMDENSCFFNQIENTGNMNEYTEKTYPYRQKQIASITFQCTTDCLNEYPRFIDVDDGALVS
jgi:hypothetical protein